MPLYFLTCVFLFWIPGAALCAVNWRRLDRLQRKAFGILCAVLAVVTFAMEYVYLAADIWSFSEAHYPLLGIVIMGAPIEEFTFWFGATPFVLGVYWTLLAVFPSLREHGVTGSARAAHPRRKPSGRRRRPRARPS